MRVAPRQALSSARTSPALHVLLRMWMCKCVHELKWNVANALHLRGFSWLLSHSWNTDSSMPHPSQLSISLSQLTTPPAKPAYANLMLYLFCVHLVSGDSMMVAQGQARGEGSRAQRGRGRLGRQRQASSRKMWPSSRYVSPLRGQTVRHPLNRGTWLPHGFLTSVCGVPFKYVMVSACSTGSVMGKWVECGSPVCMNEGCMFDV